MPLDMFRSEDMQFLRLLFHVDSAQLIMKYLGEFGRFHIIDVRRKNMHIYNFYNIYNDLIMIFINLKFCFFFSLFIYS